MVRRSHGWIALVVIVGSMAGHGCQEALRALNSARGDDMSVGPTSRDGAGHNERSTRDPGARNAAPSEVWTAAATLAGHRDIIQSVVFAPDGARLFSGSFDGQIKVWNTRTHQEEFAFVAHNGEQRLRTLAVSPSGELLASGSMGASGEVKLWNVHTRRLQVSFSYPGPVYCLVFSRDSKFVAAAGEKVVQIWRLSDGQRSQELPVETIPINGLAFSPDGRILYTGGAPSVGKYFARSGVVRAWDLSTGAKLGEIELPHWVHGLDLSRDGARLAVAAVALHLYEIRGRTRFIERFSALEKQGDGPAALYLEQFQQAMIGPDQSVVAGAATSPGPLAPDAGHVSLFDFEGRKLARLVTSRRANAAATPGHYNINTMAFSPDGRLLAAGGKEGVVTLWRKH